MIALISKHANIYTTILRDRLVPRVAFSPEKAQLEGIISVGTSRSGHDEFKSKGMCICVMGGSRGFADAKQEVVGKEKIELSLRGQLTNTQPRISHRESKDDLIWKARPMTLPISVHFLSLVCCVCLQVFKDSLFPKRVY